MPYFYVIQHWHKRPAKTAVEHNHLQINNLNHQHRSYLPYVDNLKQ